MNARRLVLLAVTSLSLAASFVVGCGAGHDPAAEDVSSGSVEAALTAVGPDGATYTFPANTFFSITQASGGASVGTLQFDQSTPSQQFVLPAGSFSGSLSNALASGSSWKLQRTLAGASTQVNATLADTQPYAFTITSGATTSLVFHFTVAGVGDITFQSGSLDAGIAVSQSATPATGATYAGTMTVTGQSLQGTSAQNSFFTAANGTTASLTMTLTRTGNWTVGVDQACAAYSAKVTGSSTSTSLAAVIAEMDGGAGQVCIGDPAQNNAVQVTMQRIGPAQAAATKAVLTGAQYSFVTFANGALPQPVFNGSTLSLSKLATPVSFTAAGVTLQVADANVNPFALLENTYDSASATFVIAP